MVKLAPIFKEVSEDIGVSGHERSSSNSNFGFTVDSRLLMEADFA